MEKQTHTPGPWRARHDERFGDWVDAPNTIVGQTVAGDVPLQILQEDDYPSRAADADLIAAAPDLLAFARAYLAMVDEVASKGSTARPTFKQLNALIDMANAAIARATAEQSA